jgi:hypothetical protein
VHAWRDGYVTAASAADQPFSFVFTNGIITGGEVRTYQADPA